MSYDYSQQIKPEDITTKDKLTLYNEKLVELLTWQGAYDLEQEALVKAELTLLYLSMNTVQKTQANLNLARVYRGCHMQNGVIVPVGSEPPSQEGDFLE